jgi:hypothetical protein
LVLLAMPVAAWAVDVGVKVEPGLAVPLSALNVSFTGSIKGMVGLGPYLDAAATVMILGLPTMAGSLSPESARAWAGGGGVVLRLPRETEKMRLSHQHGDELLFGARPWIDGDAFYVRTGLLDHFGFAAGAGVSFPLGNSRWFWLGPFVRYLQIFDFGNAKTLVLGLSLETGMSLITPGAP